MNFFASLAFSALRARTYFVVISPLCDGKDITRMMDLSKHFIDYILRVSRIASHPPDKDAVSATMLPTHDTVRLLEQVLSAHLGTIGINLFSISSLLGHH